jgi:uncharacterized protein (DUF58 family)
VVTWRPVALLAALALTLPVWPLPWLGLCCYLAAVAALSIVDIVAAAPVRAAALRRDGARQVRLGQRTSVTVTVTNRATRPMRAEIRDAWVPSAGAGGNQWRLTLLPGRSERLTTELQPTRRGDRPAERISIRSYGPLRFGYRQSTRRRAAAMTPPWTVRVLPRFESRKYLPEKLSRLRTLDGSVVTRGRGQGTEFDALREYVVGDDVRSIDWRATARRDAVVVRTWRPERDRRVLCVLDTGRTSAARVGDEPRLDAAMDACLLLAALASRADDRVDLLAIDTAVRASVHGTSRTSLLPRMVNALAPLEPALVETDFELVTSEVLRHERKRSLVVLFTALEPGALGEGLLPVLPILATRHTVLVAALHDPVVDELASRRGSTADLYQAAAAERTLAERDRVRAALAAHGVTVIDEPADLFASRVADAYLTLKAAGKL